MSASASAQIARAILRGERDQVVIPLRPLAKRIRLGQSTFTISAREGIEISHDLTDIERGLIVELASGEWLRRQRAYLLKHGIVGKEADDFEAHLIASRFRDAHLQRAGLLLTLRPELDQPRYLAPVSGYTSDPRRAIDDLEVIRPEALDPEHQRRAEARHAKARTAAITEARTVRQALDLDTRIERAKAAAKANYIDISSELRMLRKLRREAREDAARRQLHRIEQLAYREVNAA